MLDLELTPNAVSPYGDGDYFREEQVATWGRTQFWGLPHFCRVPYYRVEPTVVAANRLEVELVAPLIPHGWLNPKRVDHYKDGLTDGGLPCCFALSFYDHKQPSDTDFDDDVERPDPSQVSRYTKHACLCHVLLDGHHKMAASAQTERPVRMLSFLLPSLGSHRDDNFTEFAGERWA